MKTLCYLHVFQIDSPLILTGFPGLVKGKFPKGSISSSSSSSQSCSSSPSPSPSPRLRDPSLEILRGETLPSLLTWFSMETLVIPEDPDRELMVVWSEPTDTLFGLCVVLLTVKRCAMDTLAGAAGVFGCTCV